MSLSSFLDLSRAIEDSLAAAFVTRRGVSDAVDHRQVPIEDDAAAAQDGKPAGVMAAAADGVGIYDMPDRQPAALVTRHGRRRGRVATGVE